MRANPDGSEGDDQRPGRLRAGAARVPVALRIILAVAFVLGVTWSLLAPFGQGPDEREHFAYVQHFAETGHRPGFLTGRQTFSTEEADAMNVFGLTPLIGNVAARPTAGPIERGEWDQLERGFGKAQRSDGDGLNGQGSNPVLYYALMAGPYRAAVAAGGDAFDQIMVVRLGNVVLFLAGLVFVWLLAVELFGGTFLPTVATAAVAVFPKLTSLVGTVNTESLLFLCFSAAMYAAVRAIRHGPTVRNVALLSGAAAAAAMTQGRGLAIVPAAIIALCLALLRNRPPGRRALELGGVMAGVLVAGAVLLTVTSGGLGGGSGSAFGGAVSNTIQGHFDIGQLISTTWQFYFPKLPLMTPRLGPDYGYQQVYIDTFFAGLFGFEIVLRRSILHVLQVLSAIGLAWLLGALVVRRRAVLAGWHVVVALGAFLLGELALLHINSYEQLLGNKATDPIISGRYLVPLLALGGAAVAFCVGSLPRRYGALAAGVILAILVALQVGELGITIARFYA